MIDTTPLKAHRFASSADLMALFQAQLDRFPRIESEAGHKPVLSEFGGIMIRPQGEPLNRLTSIVFPETVLAVPRAGKSLREHNERTFPQVRLMADAASEALFICLMADHLTDDDLTERLSLVLSPNDVFLTDDIWKYFSEPDRHELARCGFGSGMSRERWAEAIKAYPKAWTNHYDLNDKIVEMRELPTTINQRGVIGTANSFHGMPGYISNALKHNGFTEDGSFFEIGSAHVHPPVVMQGVSAELAKRLGEKTVQMTLSPADVKVVRSSIEANNLVLGKYLGLRKDTAETFMSVVGISNQGHVNAIRHVDLGLIDNLDEMRSLNDRTIATIKSGKPDVGLVAAHYQFFSDPGISSDQLGGDIGQHVGNPSQLSTP